MNIDNLSEAYEIYRDDPEGEARENLVGGEFTQVFSALADEFKIPPEVLETYIEERLSLEKKYVEMLFNIDCRMNISNPSQAYKLYKESL